MDREKFYHPFEPYDVQRQFMIALYQCIEDGKVGIFESPTGKQAESKYLLQRLLIEFRNGESF